MMLATSGQALWFASRGTGIVCLLLLTVSVVLGVVTSVRFETRHWPRFVLERVHRNVSLLILVFVGLHVATTVIDGYVPIGYLDSVLPFRSPYRTAWLGLGTVAFDLMLALAITSVARARLGHRTWRAVHWLAYACWPIALLHGLGTGSDARQGWMITLDVLALASVFAAVCWRLALVWRPGERAQWAAVAALVTVPLGVGLWAIAGPLQPGWGTKRAAAAPSNPTATEPESAGFTGVVSGTRATSTAADATTTVSIQGSVANPLGLQLALVLDERRLDEGAELTDGRLTLGPRNAPSRWNGRVVNLDGDHVEASVVDALNHWLKVSLDLRVGPAGRAVSGTITARVLHAATTSGGG